MPILFSRMFIARVVLLLEAPNTLGSHRGVILEILSLLIHWVSADDCHPGCVLQQIRPENNHIPLHALSMT